MMKSLEKCGNNSFLISIRSIISLFVYCSSVLLQNFYFFNKLYVLKNIIKYMFLFNFCCKKKKKKKDNRIDYFQFLNIFRFIEMIKDF